jgi:hypothetical protein
MTTNQTIDEIKEQLEKAQNHDVNIKISYKIDVSVDFLDVCITNENSQLNTRIYHKPAAEPYILPCRSTHPRHILRNIPYSAYLRAIRICSNIDDFNSERCHIDVSLLLNGYPSNFITKQFNRLFHSPTDIFEVKLMNEQAYYHLHQRLLHQHTRREKELKKMTENPIEKPFVLQQKLWNRKIMFPKYLFDREVSEDLRKQFTTWWTEHYAYPGSNVTDVKVRLIGTTNRTLEDFFIHKKPPKEMLTKMES